MNWKTGTVLVLMAFALSLAYYVGNRLSTDALNMAVGVLCGMGASIPVSLGLLLALTRKRDADQSDTGDVQNEVPETSPAVAWPATRPAQQQQPQIIVIAPPQGQAYPGQAPYGYPLNGAAAYPYSQAMHEEVIDSRDWKIIGDDEG